MIKSQKEKETKSSFLISLISDKLPPKEIDSQWKVTGKNFYLEELKWESPPLCLSAFKNLNLSFLSGAGLRPRKTGADIN